MDEVGKPLRVLHLINRLAYGGLQSWIMEMARNTKRIEVQFDICQLNARLKKGAYEEEFQSLGGKIYRCPFRKNMLAFNCQLRQILQNGAYDILHSHFYFASGYLLKVAHPIPKLRLIAHLHPTKDVASGKRIAFPRSFYRWLMKKWIDRYADAIFGASHATLESIWGPQWRQNSRIHFQPNGIDISKYKESVDPKEVRKNLQLPEDCRIVLTVGRHVPHKKHIIIPKIASLICQEYSDVYFVIVGSGPLQSQVEKRVEQKGLQSRFRFLSKVPSLISLWKSSDVFLFPSTQEGFGIVVVEAAAAGLPVVARRIPGVTEAITACHEAILMDLDASVESWAQGVETALRKGKLEIKDYDEFEKKFPFTIRESVDALLKAYRRIVG